MSHNSTPHMMNKHTPGSEKKGFPDSSRSVSDAGATTSKQLLNAYIYDFLVKSRLPQTARSFVSEADVPSAPPSAQTPQPNPSTPSAQFNRENNLPNVAITMDCPQGFLYEWWSVFWDVFHAKGAPPSGKPASSYYHLQQMKQRQDSWAANPQQAAAQFAPQPTHIPGQQPVIHQQMGAPQQIVPPSAPQQSHQPGAPGPQPQGDYNQRMMMHQMMKTGHQQSPQGAPQPQPMMGPQQAGAQQYFNPQNRMQQMAQNQMNTLRQQQAAVVAAQQQQQQQQRKSSTAASSPAARMMPQYPYPQGPPVPGVPQQQQPQGANPQQQANPYMQKGSPIINGAVPPPQKDQAGHTRNMSALQDYQEQLMLLEKQNKKRLDIARNNGSGDPQGFVPGMMAPPMGADQPPINGAPQMPMNGNGMTSAMGPGNGPQMGQQQAMAMGKPPMGVSPMNNPQKPSPVTSTSSPVIGTKPSPSVKKKEAVSAKGRRKNSTSGANANSQSQAAQSAQPAMNAHLKKEFNTPLTPASEPNSAENKRKRKGSAPTDSPKKLSKTAAKKESSIIEETEEPSTSSAQPSAQQSAQQSAPSAPSAPDNFSVDLIDGGVFGSGGIAVGNSGGMEEIDFFKFMEGNGDAALHDGMGFPGWGNEEMMQDS